MDLQAFVKDNKCLPRTFRLNENSTLETLTGKINAVLYILDYRIEDLEKIKDLYSHFLCYYPLV